MPMTSSQVLGIIAKLKYRDWGFYVGVMGDGFYLQIRFDAPDSQTGKVETQHCRKWYISTWMTETEIVDTAYKAIETAVIHEMKEEFTYKGHMIYNPHMSVGARISRCTISEHREPPTGVAQATNIARKKAQAPSSIKEILDAARSNVDDLARDAKLNRNRVPLVGQKELFPRCDDCLCEKSV